MPELDNITIEQYKKAMNEGRLSNPLLFLESVSQGADTRRVSRVYKLVCEIEEFEGETISQSSWEELRKLIHEEFEFGIVSLSESITAAKTLAEYLYPKRKQVDISNNDSTTRSGSSINLTEEEIELFKEKFNEYF